MWNSIQYGGFEINVTPILTNHNCGTPVGAVDRFRVFRLRFAVPALICGVGISQDPSSLSSTMYETEAQAREAEYELGASWTAAVPRFLSLTCHVREFTRMTIV